MKIVVDTNIIFSALLRTQTTFGQLLFNSSGVFEFYSAQYMRTEIRRHWSKLLKISKLTDQELTASFDTVLSKITFISEEIIPQRIWENAEKLADGIDLDDTDFIALTRYLGAKLWTGDQRLRDGLRAKGFKNVFTTAEMITVWNRLRKKQKP